MNKIVFINKKKKIFKNAAGVAFLTNFYKHPLALT